MSLSQLRSAEHAESVLLPELSANPLSLGDKFLLPPQLQSFLLSPISLGSSTLLLFWRSPSLAVHRMLLLTPGCVFVVEDDDAR